MLNKQIFVDFFLFIIIIILLHGIIQYTIYLAEEDHLHDLQWRNTIGIRDSRNQLQIGIYLKVSLLAIGGTITDDKN